MGPGDAASTPPPRPIAPCKRLRVAHGHGELTYQSSTRYDGALTFDAGGVRVTATIRARRTGSCASGG